MVAKGGGEIFQKKPTWKTNKKMGHNNKINFREKVWKTGGTREGSYPIADSGISSVEYSGPANTALVIGGWVFLPKIKFYYILPLN